MSNTYSTTHLYLAAYLCASGVEFVGVEKVAEGRQSMFVFQESSERETLTRQFLVDAKALVYVHEFIAQLRRLKSIIHDG